MNNFCYTLLLFLICSLHVALGQNHAILKTKDQVETDLYHNKIIPTEDGFFALFKSPGSESRLILSKYDECYNHIWTKRYNSRFDLGLADALIHNQKLIILFVTHTNSSTTRSPIILALNMEGEIEFSYRYYKDMFENFIDISQHNDQYHIMGPSLEIPAGGGHFVISENGDLVYSNVLRNTLENDGVYFGCSVLNNGMIIRRHNNTLIACDRNQNLIWAKRIEDFNSYSLSEAKPLAVENGFVHLLEKGDVIILFKMDYSGNIVWSTSSLGRYYHIELVLHNNRISFFWKSLNTDGEYVPTYTEIEQGDGTIILNKAVETDDDIVIFAPSISANSVGDIFISGSTDEEDYIFINPHLSECMIVSEASEFTKIALEVTDVTNEYEIIPVTASQEQVDFTISDIEPILTKSCISVKHITIDTSLDCNNSYIFHGDLFGSEFLWSDGQTDSLKTFTEAQEISVFVEGNGCELNKQIQLNINESACNCKIFVPNIVLRNPHNSENLSMTIHSNCVFSNYTLSIFNRWGSLVFQSNDPEIPWTPRNYSKLNQGVYVWKLEWSYTTNSETYIDTGTIIYLR